jgi:putative addiction module component (TIGR02574 family)
MKADPQLLQQALGLGPVERAELIDALLASFDANDTGALDAAWSVEAESRIDAYESGALSAISAKGVFDGIDR